MIKSFKGEHAWLSNFAPCVVQCDQHFTYPTVEHAYQASKTLDADDRKIIAGASTAGKAKRWGREVIMQPGWNAMRVEVMDVILRQKFIQHPFAQLLVDTDEQELIEGNNWGDVFWGQVNGSGHNYLGRLIMSLRKELTDEVVL